MESMKPKNNEPYKYDMSHANKLKKTIKLASVIPKEHSIKWFFVDYHYESRIMLVVSIINLFFSSIRTGEEPFMDNNIGNIVGRHVLFIPCEMLK